MPRSNAKKYRFTVRILPNSTTNEPFITIIAHSYTILNTGALHFCGVAFGIIETISAGTWLYVSAGVPLDD